MQDFVRKSARGDGMGERKPEYFFHAIDLEATENCTDAVGLGPYV